MFMYTNSANFEKKSDKNNQSETWGCKLLLMTYLYHSMVVETSNSKENYPIGLYSKWGNRAW